MRWFARVTAQLSPSGIATTDLAAQMNINDFLAISQDELETSARRRGASPEQATEYWLTWLAAARMVLVRTDEPLSALAQLAKEHTWEALRTDGLPLESIKRLTFGQTDLFTVLRAEGVRALTRLVEQAPSGNWDVLPLIEASQFGYLITGPGSDLRPSVAELLLDLLGQPDGTLWIPFDALGVLVIRAIRRGWRVNAAQRIPYSLQLLPQLCAIETGRVDCDSKITGANGPDNDYMTVGPVKGASHALFVPPMGVHYSRGLPVNTTFDYMRSESLVLQEFCKTESKKAVFLLQAGILFTAGLEAKVRQEIIARQGEEPPLSAVIALPKGAFSSNPLATAILVFKDGSKDAKIRMVDLGLAKRSGPSLDELIAQHRSTILGKTKDDSVEQLVSTEDIIQYGYSFVPGRYIIRKLDLGEDAAPLAKICQIIRPPTPSKDGDAEEILEVGIPELGDWGVIAKAPEKRARVRKKISDSSFLQPYDVIISIKGSIGKTAIFGGLPEPAVVSQSCLALRFATFRWDTRITPVYLMMFIRSPRGQAQLEAMRIGAGVPHVSPQTLLDSFLVPVPNTAELEAVQNAFETLCQMEAEIKRLEQEMEGSFKRCWRIDD